MSDSLEALRAYKAEQKRKAEEREKPKANWFMWTEDGVKGSKRIDSVIARLLNEWAKDSPQYAKYGPPLIKNEHQAPGEKGYQRRALCTKELEGQCYACERHALKLPEDEGGWRLRTNFYINALVQYPGLDEPKVVIMSRNANASFVDDLLVELEDEGDISGANYRVRVTGEKNTTKWGLKRQSGEPFDLEGVEAYDLEATAVRHVAYEDQAEYYGAVYGNVGAPEQRKDESKTSVDADW